MITALQKSESDQNYKSDLIKASEKLRKALTEANIRLLADSMLQKNVAEMYVSKLALFWFFALGILFSFYQIIYHCRADKTAKREEKLLIKQLERNKREVEKEKKKIDLELQKEKRQAVCTNLSFVLHSFVGASSICFVCLVMTKSVAWFI